MEVELTTKLDEALKISRFASQLFDLSVIKNYDARPILRTNPDDILHLFVNLITNAIHAMEGKGTLTLGTMWAGDRIRVTISDTGSGIREEHLSKIFDPFFYDQTSRQGDRLGSPQRPSHRQEIPWNDFSGKQDRKRHDVYS